MQILFAQLRAVLFCFKFVFGKVSGIKSYPTPFVQVLLAPLRPLRFCFELFFGKVSWARSTPFVIPFLRKSKTALRDAAPFVFIFIVSVFSSAAVDARQDTWFWQSSVYHAGQDPKFGTAEAAASYACSANGGSMNFLGWSPGIYGGMLFNCSMPNGLWPAPPYTHGTGIICLVEGTTSQYTAGYIPPSTWLCYGSVPTCPLGQTVDSTNKCAPTKNLNVGISCPASKKPIAYTNLNKFLIETDYSQGALAFIRTYNSLPTNANNINLAAGWTSVSQQSIINNPSGGVVAVRPDGKSIPFTESTGIWAADADVLDRLIQLKDGGGTFTGWKYTTADYDLETYDANGKLISISDHRSLTQKFTYSDGTVGDGTINSKGGYALDANGNPTTDVMPAGLMIRITDASNRSLNFGYNISSLIVKMTTPEGLVFIYHQDINNNLTSVTYPDTKIKKYLYGEPAYTSGASLPNALTGIIDENGTRYATYYYDTTGRAIKEEMGSSPGLGIDQYQLTYTTDASGNPISTTVTNPLGSQHTYNFTTILGVVKSTGTSQPGGSGCGPAASSLTYDANGNIKTRTDFNGNTTWFDYDLSRNLETVRIEAYGTTLARTINTTWHSSFRLPTVITEPGRTSEMSYDPVSGNLLTRKITSTSDAKVRQWTYTYTTVSDGTLPNLLKTIDGPRTDISDITSYTYYPNGDLLSVSNALNHVTQITSYDPHGRPLTMVDPNSLATTLTYWPRGWLKSRSVGPETTLYDYDGVGQIKKVTLPSGAFIRYDYDDAHRLTDIWDQDNNRIHYTLDAMGNRTQEDTYDALGATVATKNRTFDALSRLYQEIEALNSSTGQRPTTTYGYDANGNQTWIQPPNQPATNHQYDALNRLFKTTDALLGITQYGYDGLDQLISVKDPRNLTTSYSINALGDQTTLTSPDTGSTNKTYDAAGNLKTSIDARNQQTTYTYDVINRVTGMSYSSGTPVSFTYDQGQNGKGRLTGMTDESGSTLWEYDAQGRVVTKTATTGALTQVLRYRYDTLGRLDQITYPSGKIVALGYLANKISSINADNQPVLTGVQYHPFSGPKLWTFGNSSLVNRNYDQSNRLFAYSLGNATRSLAFDDTGRINNIADSINPGLTQNMGYDNLDRLTSWVNGTGNQSFTYDANGNRTNLTLGATNYSNTIASTSNRISAVAGPTPKTYAYDNAGNIQSDSTNTFNYNARGRLQSVTNNSGTETYLINGLGQRVVKSGLINVRFVYDEGGKLIGEYTPSGVLIQETVYLGDLPVAVLR